MTVCPVCFASNTHDAGICSDCGADLSQPPDAALNSLDGTTSPFSSTPSLSTPDVSKPLRCKACGSGNFSNAKICEKCNQSLFSVILPQKKRSKRIFFIVIAAILGYILLISVTYVIVSFFTDKDLSSVIGKFFSQAAYLYDTEESLPEAEYMEVSYDDYAVKPNGVFGDNIKITGTVTQIERELEDDSDFLSIYVSEDVGALNIWKIGYHLKENEDIVVGEVLTFYGKSHGLVLRQMVKSGMSVYFPVIRAAAFTDNDVISGKTWSVEGSAIFDLHEDGTCTVIFGKGEEGEITDTGTYRVYRGKAAITYIAVGHPDFGFTEEELISGFDLQENINDFYCLVLSRDKGLQEGGNRKDEPSLLYLGIYSEETGELYMFSSTTLFFVTITEVTE